MIDRCIILAGGLGTRLRSAVPDLPKCMAPVAGKPFLAHVLDHFIKQGIPEFIFSLGYRHEAIVEFLDKEYTQLSRRYVVEKEPLGTGGAIRLCCAALDDGDVLVVNGDTFFGIDLSSLETFHKARQADCTLCLKPMKNFERYGVVELDEATGMIRNFHEKKYYETGLINGGIYALETGHFKKIDWPQKFSFETDYLEKYHGERKIFGQVQDKYFIDIGIPEDFEKANIDFSTMKM